MFYVFRILAASKNGFLSTGWQPVFYFESIFSFLTVLLGFFFLFYFFFII